MQNIQSIYSSIYIYICLRPRAWIETLSTNNKYSDSFKARVLLWTRMSSKISFSKRARVWIKAYDTSCSTRVSYIYTVLQCFTHISWTSSKDFQSIHVKKQFWCSPRMALDPSCTARCSKDTDLHSSWRPKKIGGEVLGLGLTTKSPAILGDFTWFDQEKWDKNRGF